jgi:hypothetical protein
MMKIIGLKAYQRGYTGCIEYEDTYELFNFARRTYHAIQEYPVSAFEDRRHFISTLGRFIRSTFFLKEPFEIVSVTQESLDRCCAAIKRA